MALSILGIGPVSALGSGVASLQAGLEGRQKPAIELRPCGPPGSTATLPVYTACAEGLDRFAPKRSLRRLDGFVRMALLASCLAVEDAGIQFEDKARVGIVLGSAYGPLQTTFQFQDSIIDDGDRGASPTAFANSVHNAPAAQVSIAMQLEGPSQTITCFGRTTAGVLMTAQAWLEEGTVDFVLAGVGDEYCPVRGYAFEKLRQGESQDHDEDWGKDWSGIEPFDLARCTHRPGEGFVAFLLCRDSFAKGRYGRLKEIGFSIRDRERLKDQLRTHRAVFLAARGKRGEAAAYEGLHDAELTYTAHSPLYGGLPVGLGFELACAALAMRDRRLYATPAGQAAGSWKTIEATGPLAEGAALACVEVAGASGYTLLSLTE
jgi:3-oxoacyl-[acyl-carrier-protein] synthase II